MAPEMNETTPPILYHCADTRSFRVLWMLEELGLPCHLRMLPFPPRFRAPEYLEDNPLGSVPLYIDGDLRMTESVAIIQYLAETHDRLSVAPGSARRGDYLEALSFGEATLTWPLALMLRYSMLEPEERRVPQVAEDHARWYQGRIRWVEERLATAPFIAGDAFSAADISVGYSLMLGAMLKLDREFGPETTRYWQALSSRSGFLAAKERQAEAVS